MVAKAKNWIKKATANKGGLHRALNVPLGKRIAQDKLAKAKKSANPKLRKEAALAGTLAKMRKKK
jgi:hypothetical protein